MSDTLSDKIVEAAAEALHNAMRPGLPWRRATRLTQRRRRANARATLTAALAVAEAEGVIFTRVPEAQETNHKESLQKTWWKHGINHCRAATLAGKVTL
jgi:hypothetical protein